MQLQLGDVFALQTKHKTYGLAWVVGGARPAGDGVPRVRFVHSRAQWKTLPKLADARRVERMDNPDDVCHSSLGSIPRELNIPKWVTYLGRLPKQASQPSSNTYYTDWSQVRANMDFRDTWLELAPQREAYQARQAAKGTPRAKQPKRTPRKVETLAAIARRSLLKPWRGLVAKQPADEARALLSHLLAALQRQPAATPARKRKLFETCVKKLNKLDEANDGFIATPEREALLDELLAIATAAGLGDISEKLDDWRDW